MSDTNLELMAEKSAAWALNKGLLMTNRENKVVHAPFKLTPTPFPGTEFKRAIKVQTSVNLLQHKVAADHSFLVEMLQETAKADSFVAKLLQLMNKADEAGNNKNRKGLEFNRTDYMLDKTEGIKQIEVNTISASFAAFAPVTYHLHKFLDERYNNGRLCDKLVVNTSTDGLIDSLNSAHKLYVETNSSKSNSQHEVVVLMVTTVD